MVEAEGPKIIEFNTLTLLEMTRSTFSSTLLLGCQENCFYCFSYFFVLLELKK